MSLFDTFPDVLMFSFLFHKKAICNEFIDNFVSVSIKDASLGKVSILKKDSKSISLNYPCSNPHLCTPYIIDLRKATYKFECWGSIGQTWGNFTKSGLGGYTSGIIKVKQKNTKIYVYIGNVGFFNGVKEMTDVAYAIYHPYCGGATDVRLITSENWWDFESLKSRIMVAAGGGGAEWPGSIGGNGGGLHGGESISSISYEQPVIYKKPCPGATQTSGSDCPPLQAQHLPGEYFTPGIGEFGSGGKPVPYQYSLGDFYHGGYGGGGYYGGTSYPYSFAGSGGSSYISGLDGCDSIDSTSTQNNIIHTGNSNHYSGIVFSKTQMISGNQTMPLPSAPNSKGIHEGTGAFRITLISYPATNKLPLSLKRYRIFGCF